LYSNIVYELINSFFIIEQGTLYTFGKRAVRAPTHSILSHESAQRDLLGCGIGEEGFESKPKIVKALQKYFVTQVAVGGYHMAAVTGKHTIVRNSIYLIDIAHFL
jgi:hypothetical protein